MERDPAWWKDGREQLATAYRYFRHHRAGSPVCEQILVVLEALMRGGASEAPEVRRLAEQAERVVESDGEKVVIVGGLFISRKVKTRTEAVANLHVALARRLDAADADDMVRICVFHLQSHPKFFGPPKPEDGVEERVLERLRRALRRERVDADALCVAAMQGWGIPLARARTLTRSLRR